MALKNFMIGKWLPIDRTVIIKWMRKEFDKLKTKQSVQYEEFKRLFPDASSVDETLRVFMDNAHRIDEINSVVQLLPVIKQLVYAMGTEPDVGMLILQMFKQQDEPNALNARDSIFLMNSAIRKAPLFVDDDTGSAIGVTVTAILIFAMATPSGYAAFIKKRINELFKNILDDYGKYLTMSDSRDVLVNNIPGGWFTPEALAAMPNFDETFNCQPGEPHKGFVSFDDFFTRTLRTDARPIAYPDNPLVVVNACENHPFRISYSVRRHDAFWIKSQPYSLQYILDNDEYIDKFEGGTVYQGFLTTHSYHRFHAPVSGVIKRAKVIAGTYFSQPYYEDIKANYGDCQPYLAHVNTRGIIIIDSGNDDVGYVAFLPIGLTDVSTVDLSPLNGVTNVKKGDIIGTFRFGGSSHLIIFEKGKRIAFDLQGLIPDLDSTETLDVRSRLATIVTDQ